MDTRQVEVEFVKPGDVLVGPGGFHYPVAEVDVNKWANTAIRCGNVWFEFQRHAVVTLVREPVDRQVRRMFEQLAPPEEQYAMTNIRAAARARKYEPTVKEYLYKLENPNGD